MKLAAIVQAHQRPEQVRMLLDALRHPQVSVYLHYDKRAPLDETPSEVTLLPRRRSRWGGAEVVDVGLGALRRGLADGCDYFAALCRLKRRGAATRPEEKDETDSH